MSDNIAKQLTPPFSGCLAMIVLKWKAEQDKAEINADMNLVSADNCLIDLTQEMANTLMAHHNNSFSGAVRIIVLKVKAQMDEAKRNADMDLANVDEELAGIELTNDGITTETGEIGLIPLDVSMDVDHVKMTAPNSGADSEVEAERKTEGGAMADDDDNNSHPMEN